MSKVYFEKNCFDFLQKLSNNNNRDWFQQHKPQYEEHVRIPALDFIEDMADDLAKISPYFNATAKKTGGSLMRVYRDMRFAKDKRPYKINVGKPMRENQCGYTV